MLIPQVGETAGHIWHTLDEEGPLRLSALKKQIDAPDLVFFMALGWLAREDKLAIHGTGRSFTIQLK
jgi:hypothetical protein